MIISMAISSPLQIVVVVDASLSHPPRSGPETQFCATWIARLRNRQREADLAIVCMALLA
jgi:hypothetical protein